MGPRGMNLSLGFSIWLLEALPGWEARPRFGTEGPEDKADGRIYVQTDSPCVLQDFVPFEAAAQKAKCHQLIDEKTDR